MNSKKSLAALVIPVTIALLAGCSATGADATATATQTTTPTSHPRPPAPSSGPIPAWKGRRSPTPSTRTRRATRPSTRTIPPSTKASTSISATRSGPASASRNDYVAVGFSELIPTVASGQADWIISNLYATEERAAGGVDFVNYSKVFDGVLVATGNPKGITGHRHLALRPHRRAEQGIRRGTAGGGTSAPTARPPALPLPP